MSNLHDPFLLPNIDVAIDRVIKAIRNKEKIFIWGDYDVDGITSTAVMITALKKFNANLDWKVPHRITDGYDIKRQSIDYVLSKNTDLLISVDCGVVAFDAINYANEKSLDVIITDHHTPREDGEIPKCLAVINPKIKQSVYPFHGLAGVGIAFKFVCAIAQKLQYPIKDLVNDTIDLVALGTVADVAPMIDENRILVKYGCARINKSTKPGIQNLIRVSRTKKVDSTNIGFTLGPRINAVGRLYDPDIALRLLLSDDDEEAHELAYDMESANNERQKLQKDLYEHAFQYVSENFNIEKDKCIIVAEKGWNPGLVGLIAGKLAEHFRVPALVASVKDDGIAKGSCRSAQGIDILKCLKHPKCLELFHEKQDGSKIVGGHSFAAGFEIPYKNIDQLRSNLSKVINKNYDLNLENKEIIYDYKISLQSISKNLIADILNFSPFGADNHLPIFLVKNVVVDEISTISDNKHIKLTLTSDSKDFYNNKVRAFWWHQGHNINKFINCKKADVLLTVDILDESDYLPSAYIVDLKVKE